MTIFKGLGRCWESIGPLRSPGKFPRPFIRHSKQIRRLLASPLYNGQEGSPPYSPSAALENFLYQPTLCLMQNFSPITYPSKGIRWLLCECELVTTRHFAHLICPPKFCISIVLNFSWDGFNIQEKMKNKGYAKLPC